MKSLLSATALAALLAAAPALAQTTNAPSGAGTPPGGSMASPRSGTSSSTKSSADAKFMERAARDGMAEVELGHLAEQKAQSPEVKALAQRLVTDHTQANHELMQIAQNAGVQLPKGIGKKNSEERAKLEKLSGQAFDRAFVHGVVRDHQKDVKEFQHQASAAQDPQLKSFVQQTLPVMEEHLHMAQQAQKQLASSGSSGTSTQSAGSAMDGRTTK